MGKVCFKPDCFRVDGANIATGHRIQASQEEGKSHFSGVSM
jgi:hypothetical protein